MYFLFSFVCRHTSVSHSLLRFITLSILSSSLMLLLAPFAQRGKNVTSNKNLTPKVLYTTFQRVWVIVYRIFLNPHCAKPCKHHWLTTHLHAYGNERDRPKWWIVLTIVLHKICGADQHTHISYKNRNCRRSLWTVIRQVNANWPCYMHEVTVRRM